MLATAFNIVGMQLITAASDAAFALTVPNDARHALISVSTNNARIGSATTVPVAGTSGVVIGAGSLLNFTDPAGDYRGLLTQIRFCNSGVAANTVINCMFFN